MCKYLENDNLGPLIYEICLNIAIFVKINSDNNNNQPRKGYVYYIFNF